MCWASLPQLPCVSTAIGIHLHPISRHFGSLAACFLVSADRAATPANLLDSLKETGVRDREVTVMSKNEKIKSMQLIDPKHLICKDTTSVIWDLDTSNTSENDTDLFSKHLRKNIAKNNNINSSDLPLTWFVYQMALKKCKMCHFSDCVQLASEL